MIGSPSMSSPHHRLSFSQRTPTMAPQTASSSGMLHSPASLPPHPDLPETPGGPNGAYHHQQAINEAAANNAAAEAAAAAGFSLSPHPPPPPHPHSGPGMPTLSGGPFSRPYSYATPGASGSAVSYDPMFGGLPTNAFGSPAAWHGDDKVGMPGTARSPGNRSNNGSTGTANEEKDPFLSLLEQLAENEQRQPGGGAGELDFFLGGTVSG